MTLQNLLKIGRLKAHDPSAAEVLNPGGLIPAELEMRSFELTANEVAELPDTSHTTPSFGRPLLVRGGERQFLLPFEGGVVRGL